MRLYSIPQGHFDYSQSNGVKLSLKKEKKKKEEAPNSSTKGVGWDWEGGGAREKAVNLIK